MRTGETLEGPHALLRRYDPGAVDFWGIVGMLHDLDWEEFPTAEDHTVKAAEMLAEAGVNSWRVRHNSDLRADLPKPEAHMEKVLYACDELSGLIQACIAVRPSHSVQDFR